MNEEIIKKFALEKSNIVWGYSSKLKIPIYVDIKGNLFSMYNPHQCGRSFYISVFMHETKDFLFVTEEWALDPHWKTIQELYNYEKEK